MPIRPPSLDDRTFDDLVAELVARIPAHTPEWTHPRLGDPGRTLLELFAWLGDTILYRANLIPERQRLAFLRLLGTPLRAARSARGLVTLAFKDETHWQAARLRPLARIEQPLPFEVRDESSVLPVSAGFFVKREVLAEDGVDAGLAEELAAVYSLGTSARMYITTPVFAESSPVSAGIDLIRDTVDRCLWIALFAPKAADQTAANDQVRRALGGHSETGAPSLLQIGFVPALQPPVDLPIATERARLPHLWEIAAPDFRGEPAYLPLDEVRDTTEGLTRPGVLRLALPTANPIFRPENDVRLNPQAGVGDRPPRLDDPKLVQRLITWLRLRPASGSVPAIPQELEFRESPSSSPSPSLTRSNQPGTPPPEQFGISWMGINAVELEQRTTTFRILLGASSGLPDQELQLPAGSVEAETFQLQVEADGAWIAWQRIDDLAAIDRDPVVAREARVFTLDSEAGVVRFGDGLRGLIPPTGARIRALVLRTGGGAAGNLPAGSITRMTAQTLDGLPAPLLTVHQPLPFEGGVDAETLAQAERRIPSLLRHRDRAITESDYRDLALETPSVRVGRVELLPRFRPHQRFDNVAGVMTVMALPARPLSPPPNPRADQPFLEAVHAWLDRRRPLGTELYVIGCQYRPLGLSTAITVAEGAPRDTTLQAVRDALRRFLWPLAPGGLDRQGWPLGRPLSDRELLVEIARVPGVLEVHGVNLFQRSGDNGWALVGSPSDPSEKNLPLAPWELPELLSVLVIAVDDVGGRTTGAAPSALLGNLAPTDLRGLPNPFAVATGIPVPVVPEIC